MKRRTLHIDGAIRDALEKGQGIKCNAGAGYLTDKEIPSPDPLDVLYSLVMDSDALERDFADWAADLGLSDNSINAQRTHELCREYGYALIQIFGAVGLEQLRELFQDYY